MCGGAQSAPCAPDPPTDSCVRACNTWPCKQRPTSTYREDLLVNGSVLVNALLGVKQSERVRLLLQKGCAGDKEKGGGVGWGQGEVRSWARRRRGGGSQQDKGSPTPDPNSATLTSAGRDDHVGRQSQQLRDNEAHIDELVQARHFYGCSRRKSSCASHWSQAIHR